MLPPVAEEGEGWFEVVDRRFADHVAGDAQLVGLAAELGGHLLGSPDEQVRRGREVLGRCAGQAGAEVVEDGYVGLIGEPPVSGRVPQRPGGVGEQWCEPLDPPVHRDVVDLDGTLGEQLLHIPIRQPVPQVPADRHCDHLRREPEPRKRRPVDPRTGSSRTTHPLSLLGRRDRYGPGAAKRDSPPCRVGASADATDRVQVPVEVAGHITAKPYPKSRAGRRTVPVPPVLVELLREHRAEHPGEDLVFTNTAGGPVGRTSFRTRMWKPALHRAGLPAGLRFHDLRHSYATWLVSDGLPPNIVQRIMGHEDVTTTLGIYADAPPDYLDRAASGFVVDPLSFEPVDDPEDEEDPSGDGS